MLGQSDDLPSIKPKVGAECLNWARSDLCGGRPAMGVPTAFFDGSQCVRSSLVMTDSSMPQ
jgi:hypothetical protein